jgi:transposase InsO family protein
MPWSEVSVMSLREEFVCLAGQEGSNVRELCRRYAISPPTAYKWLARFAGQGRRGLADLSRRPHSSPRRTSGTIEADVLAIRNTHRAWGARKIAFRLVALGHGEVPAISTITEILRRHGRLDRRQSEKRGPFQRFERPEANDLWQMDYKGHFPTETGRCHPLTVLDDHSRFSICLAACSDERTQTVRGHLHQAFQRFGLPRQIITDNGSPWGDGPAHPYTPLGAWLIRLGIAISHSRPYHPQTMGKDERFHASLKAEVLRDRSFRDIEACQSAFEHWRHIYNHIRPHEGIAMATPANRYRPSARSMPEHLAPIEYAPHDQVRKVQQQGWITFKGRDLKLPKAFAGYPVALRATDEEGTWEVFFCAQRIAQVDLRDPLGDIQCVNHVSERP